MGARVFRFTGRRTLLAFVVVLGCVLPAATGAHAATTTVISWKVANLAPQKTFAFIDIASSNSSGVQTWSVVGKCSLKGKTIVTKASGKCAVTLTVAAKGAFTATTSTRSLQIVELSKPSVTNVGETVVEGPIKTGKGTPRVGTVDFDGKVFNYSQKEFFISGSARSYTSAVPLTDDGLWTVAPAETADYKTRIVVRRPIDPAKFNGTVMVEWMNVTAGFDTPPVWSFGDMEMQRSGAIWVGVSAQRVGIEGGGNALGAALSLKKFDPERYGVLVHPGDNFSYDIFSQIGATVWRNPTKLFGELLPIQVLAMGESQSAFRLATYIDALAPLQDIYSGYFVHSRGSYGAALSVAPLADIAGPRALLSRTDIKRPVLVFSSETDVVGANLGYRRAYQKDSEWFRSWEVAGTAHGDAYSLGIGDTDNGKGSGDTALFAAMMKPPTAIYFGAVKCDLPINAGPHTYVLRSALSALDAWVRTGKAPRSMPMLEANEDVLTYQRDTNGNAKGGIRTPQVDVPIATLSGQGQSGQSFCGLFGTTIVFTKKELKALYATKAAFTKKWIAATNAAVATGAILEVDAAEIRRVAQAYPGR